MHLSPLLSFLPLLLLLPATSSTVLMMPSTNQTHLNPSDLCPLVQIVEHELCGNHVANAKNFSDLCLLLQNYNASFCSKAHAPSPSHSDDILSIRILESAKCALYLILLSKSCAHLGPIQPIFSFIPNSCVPCLTLHTLNCVAHRDQVHCLNRGLMHIACVGKMSPDMQVSSSPTLIQLRNPRSSPM